MASIELVEFSPFQEPVRPEIECAVLYNRVSDDQDGKSTSPEDQEDENREFAELNGWPVKRSYTDPGISASRWSKRQRLAYEDMLRDLQPGTVIIARKNNRLSRRLKEAVQLRDLCEERQCYLAYGGRIYDMSNYADRASFAKDAQQAEEYSDNLQNDITRKLRKNAKLGKPQGKLSFGYRIVRNERGEPEPRYDEELGHLIYREAHPQEAPIIRRLFERYIESGGNLALVHSEFVALGVTGVNGKPILYQTLRKFLMCVTYAGIRTYHGDNVAKGLWEPLVSESMFLEVQDILDDPIRKEKYGNKSGRRKKHLLSGRVICGVCGSIAQARSGFAHRYKNSKGEFLPYELRPPRFRCQVRGDHNVSRDAEFLNKLVENVLFSYVNDWRFNYRALEQLQGSETNSAEYAQLLKEARKLQKYVDDYRRSALDPEMGVSPQVVAAVEREFVPKIEALEAKAREIGHAARHDKAVLANFLSEPDPQHSWNEEYSLDTKREIIACALHIVILPTGKGKGNARRADKVEVTWVGTEVPKTRTANVHP